MATELMPSILTGAFAIGGGLGGVLLTGWLTRRNEARRLASDDARRWLSDRRRIYASFLVLAESMLREVDRIGVFLSYDGSESVSEEEEEWIQEDLNDYLQKWDDDLQPVLLEVQLMATPEVADLADRVSGALLDVTGAIETRGHFVDYYPGWFQTQDLLGVLRNAMRVELGLPEALTSARKESDWPWLSSRPPRESYIQNHSNGQRNIEANKALRESSPPRAVRNSPKKKKKVR
ncbi:hypothetical protein ABZU32_40550 [Sphaerisporangium sp. NPDC005288]|uniref:hypothetical protein n=1 Tax=Sphaerisporangium sp. NPDC005288 TaxID=3155114 RepID=UPI0033A9645D